MTYCTLEEIKSLIPERQLVRLTVDEPLEDSAIDEEIFKQCAEFSDSLIDGYVRAKYSLPLKYVPEFLVQIAKDITAYRLYLRRPQEIPEHIKENYKTALDLLKSIKKGDILLESPSEMPDDAQIPKPAPTFMVKSSPRIFTDQLLNRYGI